MNRLWSGLAVVAVAAGVAFRFIHLERKMYWTDEMHTLRVVAGYGRAEMVAELLARRQFAPAELEKYSRLAPERGVCDTVAVLWTGTSEVAPLYFVLARGWARWVGDEGTSLRWLSALLSVLTLPAMFWLARELFGSARAGWLGMLLVAVSPLQVLFAQEARMYSLWAVMVLASCAGLVRACRSNTAGAWRLYGVTVALGWYTHLLFGLALAGQALFALGKGRPAWRRFGLAGLVGTVVLAPWLMGLTVGLEEFSRGSVFVIERTARWQYVVRGVSQFSLWFWDVNTDPQQVPVVETAWRALWLALAGWAVWEMRREERAARWLVWGLTLPGLVFFWLVDRWRDSELALAHRYQLAAYLGIALAVAGWLARRWNGKLGRLVAVWLAGSGLISCWAVVRAEDWWSKGHNATDPLVGRVVNESAQPVVVVDLAAGGSRGLQALGPWLGSNVVVRVQWQAPWPTQREEFSDVFVYRPRGTQFEELAQDGYEQVADVPFGRLWRLRR